MIEQYSQHIRNVNNSVDIINGLNKGLDNTLGVSFIFTFFIVLMMVFTRMTGSIKQASATSTLLTTMMAYLAWGFGIIGMKWLIGFFIALVASTLWLWFSDN